MARREEKNTTSSYQTIAVIVALCGLGALLAAIGGVTAGELEGQPTQAAVSPVADPPEEVESHSVGEKNDTPTKGSEEDEPSDSDTSSEDLEDAEGRTADGVQPTPDDAVAVDLEGVSGGTRGVSGSGLTKAPALDTPESRVEGSAPTSPRPALPGRTARGCGATIMLRTTHLLLH